MIVSSDYVFIDIPKTASNSLDNLLIDKFDGKLEKWKKLGLLKHNRIIPRSHLDTFCFTTVRNPYDKVVSYYYFERQLPRGSRVLLKENLSLTEYIQKWYDINTSNTLSNPRYSIYYTCSNYLKGIRVDKILRFETLEKDFNTLPFVKEYTKVPRTNKSNSPGRGILTKKQIGTINSFYGEDFENFGYEKE